MSTTQSCFMNPSAGRVTLRAEHWEESNAVRRGLARPTLSFVAALLCLFAGPMRAQAQAIQAWVRLSNPTHDWLPHVGLALDASGNVVVIGAYREVADGGVDWLTTKYSSTGVPLWTNRYDGPENGWDQPSAIALDSSGNVYMAGSSWNGANLDYATIAYSSDGIPLWTNYYDGPISGIDRAYAIAVDTNGNVYVTGESEIGRYDDPDTGPWGTNDCLTIKYSSAGVPLWTNRYYRPGDLEDFGRGVTVDASGNVSVFASLGLGGMNPRAFARITYFDNVRLHL